LGGLANPPAVGVYSAAVPFAAFATKWQAGQVKDLTKGLQGLDKQISDELKQASAGSAP